MNKNMNKKEKFEKLIQTIEENVRVYAPWQGRAEKGGLDPLQILNKAREAVGLVKADPDNRQINAIFEFLSPEKNGLCSAMKYIEKRRMMYIYEEMLKWDDLNKDELSWLMGLTKNGSMDERIRDYDLGNSVVDCFNNRDRNKITPPWTWDDAASLENENAKASEVNMPERTVMFGVDQEQYRKAEAARGLQDFYSLNDLEAELAFSISEEKGLALEDTFRYVYEFICTYSETSDPNNRFNEIDTRIEKDLKNEDALYLYFVGELNHSEVRHFLYKKAKDLLEKEISEYTPNELAENVLIDKSYNKYSRYEEEADYLEDYQNQDYEPEPEDFDDAYDENGDNRSENEWENPQNPNCYDDSYYGDDQEFLQDSYLDNIDSSGYEDNDWWYYQDEGDCPDKGQLEANRRIERIIKHANTGALKELNTIIKSNCSDDQKDQAISDILTRCGLDKKINELTVSKDYKTARFICDLIGSAHLNGISLLDYWINERSKKAKLKSLYNGYDIEEQLAFERSKQEYDELSSEKRGIVAKGLVDLLEENHVLCEIKEIIRDICRSPLRSDWDSLSRADIERLPFPSKVAFYKRQLFPEDIHVDNRIAELLRKTGVDKKVKRFLDIQGIKHGVILRDILYYDSSSDEFLFEQDIKQTEDDLIKRNKEEKDEFVMPEITEGMAVIHPSFGEGTISKVFVNGKKILVKFASGEKPFITDKSSKMNAFRNAFLTIKK